MTYTIIDGEKAQFIGEGHEFTFECDPMDIDTAYDILAENLRLNNEGGKDVIDFQNAEDDNVETMLDDMKRMGFIDSWEKEEF
ncbi:hypothetical protein [Limosilactobacillus antri]|uniref:hypothetical protein n=1 Tax=Limosilactobacillus antri TaxID=227943 RepID=UPI001F5794DA|nr:hypothetical protein [Limosilactobacillus antri]